MNRIEKLIVENELTYRDVSELTKIDLSSLNKLAKYGREIRKNHVDVLTSFFDVTSDYLLGNSICGIVVYEQIGDRSFELSEECYNELKPYINVSIIKIENPFVFNIITSGVRRNVVQVEKCLYREIKGSFDDYLNKEIISKCVNSYIKDMDVNKAKLLLELAKGMK